MAAASPAAAATLCPNDLLVADRDVLADRSGAIFVVDPASGDTSIVAQGGDVVDPEGVVVEADGDILVLDQRAFGGTGGPDRSSAQPPRLVRHVRRRAGDGRVPVRSRAPRDTAAPGPGGP